MLLRILWFISSIIIRGYILKLVSRGKEAGLEILWNLLSSRTARKRQSQGLHTGFCNPRALAVVLFQQLPFLKQWYSRFQAFGGAKSRLGLFCLTFGHLPLHSPSVSICLLSPLGAGDANRQADLRGGSCSVGWLLGGAAV